MVSFGNKSSKALGSYVGLIVTNCIIMGCCEAYAYAQKNPSMIDTVVSVLQKLGISEELIFFDKF